MLCNNSYGHKLHIIGSKKKTTVTLTELINAHVQVNTLLYTVLYDFIATQCAHIKVKAFSLQQQGHAYGINYMQPGIIITLLKA